MPQYCSLRAPYKPNANLHVKAYEQLLNMYVCMYVCCMYVCMLSHCAHRICDANENARWRKHLNILNELDRKVQNACQLF